MRHAARHEPIGRAIGGSPIAVMTMADVVLRENAAYPEVKTFHCSTLRCDISPSACAANYTRGNAPLSCKGCPIGSAHAGGQNYRNESSNIHAKSDNAIGLSCIRCERNGHTATRYISRFRLVSNHTICINCFNRGREIEKFRAGVGGNAKGGVPQKWAHLQQATITIEEAAGEWQTLDIGLRSGRGECERYVARIHPGCVLVEVFMGGHAVQPGDPDRTPTDWQSERTRKGRATRAARKQKPLAVASGSEAFDDEDDCWPSRNAVEVEPVESALDPESIAAHGFGNSDGLPDFIEWLCEGWPAAPSAPVADAIAPAEVAEPVLSESEQPENESEWAGCYLVRDGVTTYVCDYAKDRGISDEEAAIVLGMCDPDYSDEPEAAAAPEPEPAPEPVKAEPIPKKLTGKQLRKLEKAQRRLERSQPQPAAPAKPTLISSPKAIAITARAMVQVAFELNGIR